MTFHPEKTENFLQLFEEKKALIRAYEGCQHLELWRNTADSRIFFTYSYWESEAALNHYRYSDLFKNTWAQTKILFVEKPEAWSVEVQTEVK